jgi:hypothetical protein
MLKETTETMNVASPSHSAIFHVSYYAQEDAWDLFSRHAQPELYLDTPLAFSSTLSLLQRGKPC